MRAGGQSKGTVLAASGGCVVWIHEPMRPEGLDRTLSLTWKSPCVDRSETGPCNCR